MMSSAVGVDSSGLIQGLDAIQSNDFNSTYIRQLSSVAEVVYNYTSCIDLDRFEAVSTEAELEKKAEMLYKNNTFLGGKKLKYFQRICKLLSVHVHICVRAICVLEGYVCVRDMCTFVW